MAIDFPASPINGTTHTAAGAVWQYDGTKWKANPVAIVGDITAVTAGAGLTGGGTAGDLTLALQVPVSVANGGTGTTTAAAAPWVEAAGDAMTGLLTLSGPPTTALQAATKGYVDGFLPLTGGTLTGNLAINPASGDAALNIQKAASGAASVIIGLKGTLPRWKMFLGNGAAESTGNVGSDFVLVRSNDAGTDIDVPLSINRATGGATFLSVTSNGFTSTGNSWFQTYARFGNTTAPASTTQIGVCSPASTYGIAIRPNVGGVGGMLAFENVGSALIGSITNNDTSVAYNTSSDARLKEDARDFDAGPMIDATMVYDFAWIASGERAYGVIAQEAVEVYPQAVSYIELQDSWGVDYSKYVPLLLQEIKMLRVRVAALEGGTPAP